VIGVQLEAPRLLLAAHGTDSTAGQATLHALRDAVADRRPGVHVEMCFLDVIEPRLSAALDDSPTVVVPVLLSTGFHVQTDIPATVAGHSRTQVARHLGPDPLVVQALADRLPPTGTPVLVAAGSSRPEAAVELAEAGAELGALLGEPVTVATIGDGLRATLARLAPVRVATYLLAQGQFESQLRAAADGLGTVADPLGDHPALVELIWSRYDECEPGTG
jgi:sirohydrochlorin ferrochelatase